jgi:hypothetical protein
MPIRVHAEETGRGVLLSRIEMQADVESLCSFFSEKGAAATAGPQSVPGDNRVFLAGLTMEQFAQLIEWANVELI